jgi:hypothetical protein
MPNTRQRATPASRGQAQARLLKEPMRVVSPLHSRNLRIVSPRYAFMLPSKFRWQHAPRGWTVSGRGLWIKAARGNVFRFDDVSGKMNLVLHTWPSAHGPHGGAGAGPHSRILRIGSPRFPRFAREGATKTARGTKASSFAPPAREILASGGGREGRRGQAETPDVLQQNSYFQIELLAVPAEQ